MVLNWARNLKHFEIKVTPSGSFCIKGLEQMYPQREQKKENQMVKIINLQKHFANSKGF